MDLINYLNGDQRPVLASLETPGFTLSIYPAFRFLDMCSPKIIEFIVDLSIVDIPLQNIYKPTPVTQFKFKIYTGFQLICLEQFIDFFSKNSQLDPTLYLNRDFEDNHFEDSICNMDYELVITLTSPFGEKKDNYEFDINVCLNLYKESDTVRVSIESMVSNNDCLAFAQQLNQFKKYFLD